MSDILFWTGVGLMIVCTVFTFSKIKRYAQWGYGAGLVLVTIGAALYPHAHGVAKWVGVTILALCALVYLFAPVWEKKYTDNYALYRERKQDAREEGQQGQGDREVPEGTRGQEDD